MEPRVLVFYAVSGVGGVVAGIAAVKLDPIRALGALLALAFLIAALTSARARVLACLGGALLVFQAPGDAGKIAYLGVVAVCLAIALTNLIRSRDELASVFQPMLSMAIVVVFTFLSSFLVAMYNGIPALSWFRDVLTYFLLAALPIIGLEAALTVSRRFVSWTLTSLGVVAALGFATDWLNRRGAVDGLGRFVLATATFSLLALIYVALRCCSDRRPLGWFLVGTVITGALLITGTRTNIVLILAALVGMAGPVSKARVPIRRVIGFTIALAGAMSLTLPLLSSRLFTRRDFLNSRLQAFVESVEGGLSADQSFQLRAASYAAAQSRWEEHPWLGGAPGYVYPFADSFSLDTPWVVPAKFGILGTGVLVTYLLAIVWSLIRVKRTPEIEFTMARSWTFAMIALLPFGPWLEDKGSSLAIMVIVLMTSVISRTERSSGTELESTSGLPHAAQTGLPGDARIS